ncbi:MAG: aconitate hydratase AcnA, partial [Gammaproteobacteria bacterium]|nr:aconitate hydratase AcnA [Gammaproteobacteria bacterium]
FDNFRVVPPGTGICHQVNLEYLARVVWDSGEGDERTAFPDTLVGTDSHTTMVNALGVLGWGVGGIEAEAAMLGQPVSMLIPEVVGFEFSGRLREGITATDLVLRVVEMLRAHGVVGKFVEFFGDGLDQLTVSDRATIANMSPEYGATCGFFPVDEQTIDYLRLTGRSDEQVQLVEAYCREQGLWRLAGEQQSVFASQLQLDLAEVKPSMSGPTRPQDRVDLGEVEQVMSGFIKNINPLNDVSQGFELPEHNAEMHHGDVVVAAITSCTNTSNPAVMVAAGLVAKKARALGLTRKPWVKTSLAPGSKVVTDYLHAAGLQQPLNELGFNLTGYGCTTCIGNSGPLSSEVSQVVTDNALVVSAVLSGNRNFEGRIHPLVQANWLASPPLIVAYAIAGTTCIDIEKDVLGNDKHGKPVYLKDLWPNTREIAEATATMTESMYDKRYGDVFTGDDLWRQIKTESGTNYQFDTQSTYIQRPEFFDEQYTKGKDEPIIGARILALLGDSVTTDHISPAGNIAADSPAAQYLRDCGVAPRDFNSYGSRRGNHQVMVRGTFANIRIRNELLTDVTGGFSKRFDSDEIKPIFEIATDYMQENVPTVVIAGREYGTGSSRDWAAKGTLLLGVKAVIVESFERIHRSNLVGMGVLPLQFPEGVTRNTLGLTGEESIDILVPAGGPGINQKIPMRVHRKDGTVDSVDLLCRIDTAMEVAYFMSGGILELVLDQLANQTLDR